jgi:hypothetical protein
MRKIKKIRTFEEIFKALQPEFQKEVKDFAEFLLEKRSQKSGCKLTQSWAGALRDYRDQYTSLELQKKAMEWREAD